MPTLQRTARVLSLLCLFPSAVLGVTETIELDAGWNLIAFQLEPTDPSITSVLAPIDGTYDEVWAYNNLSSPAIWQGYRVSGASTLSSLHVGRGYWIHMLEAATLEVSGTPREVCGSNLESGWNLVGPYSPYTISPADAAEGISGAEGEIWGLNGGQLAWGRYSPAIESWLNNLLSVRPAGGYWVFVNKPTQWRGPIPDVAVPTALNFGRGPDEYILRITNACSGSLSWSFSLTPEQHSACPELEDGETYDELSRTDVVEFRENNGLWSDTIEGTTGAEGDFVSAKVNWSKIPVGRYCASVAVQTNGGDSTIPITIVKAPIEGHYVGTAIPLTVNGIETQLPQVHLGIDIGADGDWSVLTAEQTPFFPRDVFFHRSGENDTLVLGATFEVKADDDLQMNMFRTDLVRSVMLRGDRASNNTIEGKLEDSYVETLEFAGSDPIVVRGTFQLTKAARMDVDEDGLPDDWELRFGLDPSDPTGINGPSTDYPDSDGFINWVEYQNRTDPTVDDSELPTPASIFGRVTEKDGGPMENIVVTLHFATLVLTRVTDTLGAFSFEDLAPGYYTIRVGGFPGYSFTPSIEWVSLTRRPFELNINAMRNTTDLDVEFVASPLEGEAPLTVQFVILSTTNGNLPAPTFWMWNFGDGNFQSGVNEPPPDVRHTYTSPGSYQVTLSSTWGNFPLPGAEFTIRVGGPGASDSYRLAQSFVAFNGGHTNPCVVDADCDGEGQGNNLCTVETCEAGFCVVAEWMECPEGQGCASGECVPPSSNPSHRLKAVLGTAVFESGAVSASSGYRLDLDYLP